MFRNPFARRKLKSNSILRRRPTLECLEDRMVLSTIVALTNRNQLITFDSANPNKITKRVDVSGLPAEETLVTLDFNPSTGQLLGIGSDLRLYSLNPTTGVATGISAFEFDVDIDSRTFDADFNPTNSQLRVIAGQDQNLRVNAADGTVIDGNGTTAGVQGDTNVAFATGDTNNGRDLALAAITYNNNTQDAVQTSLFGIDVRRNLLVRIGGVNGSPLPDGGTVNTIGSLGRNAVSFSGMDVGGPGTAFAALSQPTRHGPGKDPAVLVSVNLTNGSTAPFGRIGKNELILDLAVTVRDEVLFGLTTTNELVKFNSADPSNILQTINVTGMQTGENLVSIDFRPTSGQLFGVGSTGRIYQVNVTTGAATQVGTSTVTPALDGANFGSDFNPVTDRLRVVSDDQQNLRIDPTTGQITNNTADAALAYLAGDSNFNATPRIVASAHDGNFATSTGTTLFGIDSALDILVRQGSVQGTPSLPNNGELTTLGALGLDVTDEAGMDIGFGSGGVALAVFQKPGETFSRLYRVNLTTGAATEIGRVGSTTGVLRDVAIAPPVVELNVDSVDVDEDAGTARVVLKRSGGSSASAAVTLNSANGSAIGGQDFIAVTNQTVTFPAGENLAEFLVTIVNDSNNEDDETLTITLSSPTNGMQLGTPITLTIRIRDND